MLWFSFGVAFDSSWYSVAVLTALLEHVISGKKKKKKIFCHFFVKKSLKCVNKGQEWATIHLR